MTALVDLDPLAELARGVEAGRLIPYLGPGVLALTPGGAPVPDSPEAFCRHIESRVALPRRARGNLWAAAQFVESRKFRRTLEVLVAEAFAEVPTGNPVHQWLARVRPPLVVDAWYDDGLPVAFGEEAEDWGIVRGETRHSGNLDVWTRAYDAGGMEVAPALAEGWSTIVYKPHGCVRPGGGVLLSDSDYVEVLTEIDIQTPIPEVVQARRQGRGFLFLGCRFDDQLLRIFARQIMKRSGGPHYAVIAGELTRMEQKFLDEQQVVLIPAELEDVLPVLAGG